MSTDNVVPSHYYDIDQRQITDTFIITPSDTVYIDGEQVQESDGSDDSVTIHLTKSKHRYALHRLDGPAYIEDRYVIFAHMGLNLSINDMPIDDQIKIMLLLKYGSREKDDGIYVTYTNN